MCVCSLRRLCVGPAGGSLFFSYKQEFGIHENTAQASQFCWWMEWHNVYQGTRGQCSRRRPGCGGGVTEDWVSAQLMLKRSPNLGWSSVTSLWARRRDREQIIVTEQDQPWMQAQVQFPLPFLLTGPCRSRSHEVVRPDLYS